MRHDTTTILASTLVVGLLLVLAVGLFGSTARLGGAVAGASIGFLNLYFWVLVVKRLIGQGDTRRLGLILRLLLKYGLTGALIALFLVCIEVDLIGFALGISDLVLGPLVGGLWVSRRETR